MTESQQVINSTGSIQSPEKIEDSFKRMKVTEDNNVTQTSPFPDRPGERDCQFYLRTGLCSYGNSCRYNHPTHLPQGIVYYKDELPERIGQPDCEYFLKTGACKYGSTCKYHHPKDRNGAGPVLFNFLGYPMRQGEKSCPYYMRTGMCRFGVACKFHHPQPVNGHSTYGVSSFPSVGFPYSTGLTMVSLPPATYGAVPHAQVPQHQAYMPYMVAPPQGLLPPQGWTTYMTSSNPIYNMKNQPDSSSSASMPVAVTSHQNFSERSGPPECRFFMNTGTCKYGDDCKYSHPKERILQASPNLLNPYVLPARPGQPACGNFAAYGFCKFGPTCKFDHSMPLIPYNNTGLTMSSLPSAYAPPVSTHLKISAPPIPFDSTALSNGKPDEKNQSSEIEKHLSYGKPDEKIQSSEIEKQEDDPSQQDNSEVQDSSDNST